MRCLASLVLLAGLAVVLPGCGSKRSFDGPTVDAFVGRLTHDRKPVSFPQDEKVSLQLFHETGESFGIPIQPDGTFKIGWMPIGKYGGVLQRRKADGKSPPSMYNVPDGLTIQEGQTEYVIELGKDWKP